MKRQQHYHARCVPTNHWIRPSNEGLRPTGSLLSMITDQVTQHTDEAVERSAMSSPSAT